VRKKESKGTAETRGKKGSAPYSVKFMQGVMEEPVAQEGNTGEELMADDWEQDKQAGRGPCNLRKGSRRRKHGRRTILGLGAAREP